jgi:hypothetical protein
MLSAVCAQVCGHVHRCVGMCTGVWACAQVCGRVQSHFSLAQYQLSTAAQVPNTPFLLNSKWLLDSSEQQLMYFTKSSWLPWVILGIWNLHFLTLPPWPLPPTHPLCCCQAKLLNTQRERPRAVAELQGLPLHGHHGAKKDWSSKNQYLPPQPHPTLLCTHRIPFVFLTKLRSWVEGTPHHSLSAVTDHQNAPSFRLLCSVDQAGLELTEICLLCLQGLGLKASATTAQLSICLAHSFQSPRPALYNPSALSLILRHLVDASAYMVWRNGLCLRLNLLGLASVIFNCVKNAVIPSFLGFLWLQWNTMTKQQAGEERVYLT